MSNGDQPPDRPMYWGPGSPKGKRELVDSWTPGGGYADTWGPYHQALFPARKVTPWIRFKTMSSGANIAQRLWDEREALRLAHEAARGDDPEQWPVRHPGVVLESVLWVAHAACLRCQWFDRDGTYMKEDTWRTTAAEVALQHQHSP
jgi:hypothetical protein